MPYVDGFVIPLPKKSVPAYRRMAAKAAKIWIEHGALELRECVAEDLYPKALEPDAASPGFPKMARLKKGETVVFSWIVYRSKADRDRVNKKVMGDPRIQALGGPNDMPFDAKRMAYGGFRTMVDVTSR